MDKVVFMESDKSSQDTSAKSDVFQRIYTEELYLKSNSPGDMPVLVEFAINPKSENFQMVSKHFYILNLKCKLTVIGFKHSNFLEVYINIENKDKKDAIFSISFEFWLKKLKTFLILSVNLAQKSDFLLGKFPACVPNSLILKGQYEKIHSLLVNELLEIRPEAIENCFDMFTIDRLKLILASDNLRTKTEDEVLEILGLWTNNNSFSDEELKDILKLVRWEFVSMQGLIGMLKYPILKSSTVFKSYFKKELLNKSGILPNSTRVKPRILYKPLGQSLTFPMFCDQLANTLFPIENIKTIEQNACKIIENTAKVKKLKSKLSSLQNTLNSTLNLNSSTPVPTNSTLQPISVTPFLSNQRELSITPSLHPHKSPLNAKLTISLLRKKLKRFNSVDSTPY